MRISNEEVKRRYEDAMRRKRKELAKTHQEPEGDFTGSFFGDVLVTVASIVVGSLVVVLTGAALFQFIGSMINK